MTDETMPSISVLTSLTLVCDSNRGLGSFTLSTQTRPSRTSSPEMAGSFSFSSLFCLGVLVDGAGQGGAEAGQVRAAVRVGDRVGEAEDLVVVAVGVLHHAIHEHLVLLPADDDGLGMEHLLGAPKLLDELLDAVLVEEGLGLLVALVREDDLDARVQEGQLAQAVGEHVELELGRDGEDGRVGLEGDQRAGALGLADDGQLLRGHAARELHRVDLAVARDLDLEPVRERIDALGADAVQAAGVLVGALAELAARVQVGQHQLHRRHVPLRMHVHRDAAPVVADGHRAVHVDRDLDLVAIAGQVLVNGVVQHLENAVVQPALIRVADVHARAFAHRLQPLELVNLRRIVLLRCAGGRRHFFGRFNRIFLRHKIVRTRHFGRPFSGPEIVGKMAPKHNCYFGLILP